MNSSRQPPRRSREELLADTRRRYQWYRESGYSERWSTPSTGAAIAIADRNKWVLDSLSGVAGTIVDLGCGSGDLAVLIDQAGLRPDRYIGVDLIEQQLEAARARVPSAEFYLASADQTSVASGSSEAVVAMTLLSSIPDDWFRQRIALEVDRVLQPGGRFIIYDLRYPSPRNGHVRPVNQRMLADLFPRWHLTTTALTLAPPLARSLLAAGPRRYALLESVPLLRSHIGAIITKPLAP